MAKIVKKCGTKDYWENWVTGIAKVAQTHITRLKAILTEPDTHARHAFDNFLTEIRDDLNPNVSEEDAIEMLAQHIITKPVFDALFEGYSFAANNPVSRAMQTILDVLQGTNLEKEADVLQKFYASVRRRAAGINSGEAKQRIVVELYDTFFRKAFPRMTEKLGIVYTPVEVVDFIIHSVNDVLQSEFGQTLGSKGVHILDPFTGTGTFITRLLQSGLIKPEELERKYKHEMHANEIVLLAYYIAAINIEAVYHDMAKENAIALGESGEDMPYAPFDGIVLTDTFQLYEQDKDMIADLLPDNSERRTAQKERDIRVIVGNPPYSSGQKNANDNAANVFYPNLDAEIRTRYAEPSKSGNKNGLYNSYIKAISWSLQRLEGDGVVAFVASNGWTEKPFADAMRKHLAATSSKLFIFNLRGDVRKNMLTKGAAQEGENIFDNGSMNGNCIFLIVRNSSKSGPASISYHDIGNDLTLKEKRQRIVSYQSVNNMSEAQRWVVVEPNENGDWLDQRDEKLSEYPIVGAKRGAKALTIFNDFSRGSETGRDAWVSNASQAILREKVSETMQFYAKFLEPLAALKDIKKAGDVVDNNPKKIKWTGSLFSSGARGVQPVFEESFLSRTQQKPFGAQWLYFDPLLIHRRGQLPKIFPTQATKNFAIHTAGVGARSDFSALMVAGIPDIQHVENGQCLPLKLYEPARADDGLFASGETGYTERDGISDAGLEHFQDAYAGEQFSKEDLFYYIYGLLHSPGYRERFKNNLSKQLPRIPPVKQAADFWAFSRAGRALGDLHVNYETVDPYPVTFREGALELSNFTDADYRVEKMKFGGKRPNQDKTTVIYNHKITMENIPLEAYDYVVNGKSALDWVMERQCVKTDKASEIVNDANDYAIETVGDAAYPLKLFQRVITVSLETMKIVNSLPKLDID